MSINLQHTTYFAETLKDAFINSIMLVFLPRDFVFMESYDIQPLYFLHFPNIRQSIQMDSTHNAAKAKRLWRETDFYTAKKNVLHGIRYLSYAIELLETGSIINFEAGNEYFDDIMNWEEPSGENSNDRKFELWRALEQKYSPMYTEMTTKIREFCQVPVDAAIAWERRWIANRYNVSEIVGSSYHLTHVIPFDILIDYLNEFGLIPAARDFGITFTAHSEHPDLFTLGRTQMATLELSITQWSSGIVIKDVSADKSRTRWEFVAAPLPKIFSPTSSKGVISVVDWSKSSSIVLEELLDGAMAMLYHYEGKWYVASKSTPDGSNLLGWVCPIRHENWKELVIEGFNFNPVHEANMLVELRPGKPNPTFAEHFWEVFTASNMSLDSFDTSLCYCFELLSVSMINIVEHKSNSLVLLTVRDAKGIELNASEVSKKIGASVTQKFTITEASKATSDPALPTADQSQPLALFNANMELLYTSLRFMDPTVSAGFVLRLETGARLAVRSPQYDSLKRLHPLSDQGLIQKLLLDLVRAPYPRTWLSLKKFSYWTARYSELENTYQAMCTYFQQTWDVVRKAAKVSRNDSAALLVDKPFGFAEMFLLIKLQRLDADIRDHFTIIPSKRLQGFLKTFVDPKTVFANFPTPEPSSSSKTSD